jgi:acyl dehydratase
MRTISSLEELKQLAGEELAVSEWIEVGQDQINLFADATGDRQWIHVDPVRSRDSAFGGTVAHGLFSVSLIPMLLQRSLAIEGFHMMLNYGFNRVRFPAPLPVNSRIRARIVLQQVEELGQDAQTTWQVTVEREGGEKPICVAEMLVRHVG